MVETEGPEVATHGTVGSAFAAYLHRALEEDEPEEAR